MISPRAALRRAALAGSLAAPLLSLPAPAPAAVPPPETGLRLRLEGNGTDTLVASNLFLHVEPGNSPSPLLAPGAFRATWAGTVSTELRGDFRFQARGSGRFHLEINGQRVLDLPELGDPSDEGPWSEPVRLRKGTNLLTATLEPPPSATGRATSVRLLWQGRGIPPGPLPQALLQPSATTAQAPDSDGNGAATIREGRALFLRLRCGLCHTAEAPSPVPELAMSAPDFLDYGARRQAGWTARWITDPRKTRASATMPAALHGPESESEARAIAAWLDSLRPATPAVVDATPGNPATGKALFGSLHCASCHTGPGESPAPERLSLAGVGQKFAPGALPAFLRKPQAHATWSRMPDFQLSREEAAHLAAWLSPPASTEPPTHGDAPPPSPGLLQRGRDLVESRGCLNCHPGPEGARNRLKAPPLSALPAAHWNRGCLAEVPPTTGSVPWYDLGRPEREALRAFGSTDRASVGRHVPSEFADRWTRELKCDACHASVGNLPGIHLAGEKLKPEWMGRLLSGNLGNLKARPWIQARMPAFPGFAPHLAPGLAAGKGLPPASPPEPPLDPGAAALGRRMVSASGGFACVTCHAIGAAGSTAVFEAPGINLALATSRLRREFFDRWVRNPQSVDPSTRMPLYFDEEGNSPLAEFYEGNGPRTVNALWHYLLQAPEIPPPPP